MSFAAGASPRPTIIIIITPAVFELLGLLFTVKTIILPSQGIFLYILGYHVIVFLISYHMVVKASLPYIFVSKGRTNML